MSPGGKHVAKDLYEVGGVPIVIKSLLDGGYINGDYDCYRQNNCRKS